MRKVKPIVVAMIVTLLALPLGAQATKGGNSGNGGQSQAGGLPALAKRVDALQSALSADITNLQNQINTLDTDITNLQDQINALDASTAFISMNFDGTVNYSKDVDTSNPALTGRTGVGSYQVLFTRDVSKCAAVASVHPPVGPITPAFAMVGRSSATQVTVVIFSLAGTALDDGFELAVMC
jgi:hypothetical protein